MQLHAALTCCCRPSSSSACCVSDSCRKVLRADCRAQTDCQISTLDFWVPLTLTCPPKAGLTIRATCGVGLLQCWHAARSNNNQTTPR